MTDNPVLIDFKSDEWKLLVEITTQGLMPEPAYAKLRDLIRAQVVKALDGIELPKEMEYTSTILHNFVDAHNKAISEAKQAIQKAKEAYL